MIELFDFSWQARIAISFLLGIGVLSQTFALVLSFYRHSISLSRVFENLLEVAILFEIFIFSLMHGQIVKAYNSGFLVDTGYEKTRILIFSIIIILVIIVSLFNRNLLQLGIIPAAMITLPSLEKWIGVAFPWLFIGALFFFLIRSIKVWVSSITAIKTNISALSVIHAIDTLHTGVLFSENDGYTLLSNHQMQSLMLAITGKVFRNAIEFYDLLASDQDELRCEKSQLEGKIVYFLPDKTTWMFTKTDISLGIKKYVHISAADVSELWALTTKLQLQDQELRRKSLDLKETIANLHILSKKKELENAQMRAHDILGQRLTILLRTIQNQHDIDHELLASLTKGLLAELKAEQNGIVPCQELKNIQEIFAAIGVDINFEGQLPENKEEASLFVEAIREGSTNAVRHGFATQIKIKAEEVENTYKLTISNNGHTSTTPIVRGDGIRLMRKKITALGGDLEIIDHPLFTLSIVLPGGDQDD